MELQQRQQQQQQITADDAQPHVLNQHRFLGGPLCGRATWETPSVSSPAGFSVYELRLLPTAAHTSHWVEFTGKCSVPAAARGGGNVIESPAMLLPLRPTLPALCLFSTRTYIKSNNMTRAEFGHLKPSALDSVSRAQAALTGGFSIQCGLKNNEIQKKSVIYCSIRDKAA